MMYRPLFTTTFIAAIAVVGCAVSPQDDWHQFTVDILPATQSIQRASAAWGRINAATPQSAAPPPFALLLEEFDKVIAEQDTAIKTLEASSPRTAEVQAARQKYLDGMKKMQAAATAMRDMTSKMLQNNTPPSDQVITESTALAEEGRKLMREAGGLANALNEKYGRAVIEEQAE